MLPISVLRTFARPASGRWKFMGHVKNFIWPDSYYMLQLTLVLENLPKNEQNTYEPESIFPIDQIAMISNWLIDYYMLQSSLVLENLPKNVQM